MNERERKREIGRVGEWWKERERHTQSEKE
jgi:hypothetical protein